MPKKKTENAALSPAQIEHFLSRGFVIVPGCFTAAAAKPWIDGAWKRLGADPAFPETWPLSRGFVPGDASVPVASFAPKAWAAICALVGGEERIAGGARCSWSNSFVVRFPSSGPAPYLPPSPKYEGGWHIDGDDAKIFLDAAEPALMAWALWTDAELHGGGGTYLACDSVPLVADYLLRHPEGANKIEAPIREIVARCRDFHEYSGRTGDVLLALPQMVHCESDNHSGHARFLAARAVALTQPLNFDRADPREFSVVERAILRALGRERLSFRRTA